MKITKAILLIFAILFSSCTNDESISKLDELLNNRMSVLKTRIANDGVHADINSIYKGLKVIRTINSPFIAERDITQEFNKLILWDWLDFNTEDSVKIMSHVQKIVGAKENEDALIEELELFDYFDELIYNSYYHFRSIQPIVYGNEKNLSVGESDTLRFIIAGQSGTLRNAIYLGNTDSLNSANYWVNKKPIYDDVYEKEDNIQLTKFIIKGDKPGKHILTGVIEKPDKGKQIKLPFKYEYTVK